MEKKGFLLDILVNHWLIFLSLKVESTLRQLFDQHDIVPEEHEWGGSKCPFNIDEYFTLPPPGSHPLSPFSFHTRLHLTLPRSEKNRVE